MGARDKDWGDPCRGHLTAKTVEFTEGLYFVPAFAPSKAVQGFQVTVINGTLLKKLSGSLKGHTLQSAV